MRAKIVRIGNSQGVRLPKPLLEQAGLTDDVEITAEAGQIIIASRRVARSGWAEAAKRLGISQPRLNDLLRGRIGRFSLDALIKIATSAGIGVNLEFRDAA